MGCGTRESPRSQSTPSATAPSQRAESPRGCRLAPEQGLVLGTRRAPTQLAVGAEGAIVVHQPSIFEVFTSSSPGFSDHLRSGAVLVPRSGPPRVLVEPGTGGGYTPDPRALWAIHVDGEAALLDCESLGSDAARCTIHAPSRPAFDARSFTPGPEITSLDRMVAVEHEGVVHVVIVDEALSRGRLVHLGPTSSEAVSFTPPTTEGLFGRLEVERIEGGVRLILRGHPTQTFALDHSGHIREPLAALVIDSPLDSYIESRRARGLEPRSCVGTPGTSEVLVLCDAPSPEGPARLLWVGWADAERPDEATELPTQGSGVAALDRAAGHAAIAWEAVTADAPELRFASLRCD